MYPILKCGIVAIRKNIVICLLCSVLCTPVLAQVSNAGRSVFSFMGLPVSSRINALGGSNVSLSDGDISMGMCNPALLHANSHMMLQLNYSYYLPGTMFGSALYGHNFGRSKVEKPYSGDGEPDKPNYFAVGLHYLDYGRIPYANDHGTLTGGRFGARDIRVIRNRHGSFTGILCTGNHDLFDGLLGCGKVYTYQCIVRRRDHEDRRGSSIGFDRKAHDNLSQAFRA